MKNYVFMGIISLILVSLAFLITLSPNQGFQENKSIENELNLKIQTLEGDNIFLSDFLGKRIIVDFFATWCVPCETQARLLQRFTQAYPSVNIISVSVDGNDDIPKLKDYQERTAIPWLFGRDIDLKANEKFGTYQLPTIAYIDSNGILKQLKHAVATFSELEDWILNKGVENSSSTVFYLFGVEFSSTLGIALFFLVGLYVALSPCLFPIMPITLMQIMRKQEINETKEQNMHEFKQYNKSKRFKVLEWVYMLWTGILFSFGIFALIGVAIGFFLIQYYLLLNFLFGFILIILGYIILIPRLESKIFASVSIPAKIQRLMLKENFNNIDLFSLGAVYSIIAIPCSGPVFIALLPLIIGHSNPILGFINLLVFSIGLLLPYLFLILLASEAQSKFVKGLQERYNIVKNVTAILIIFIGGLLAWPFFGGPVLFAIG